MEPPMTVKELSEYLRLDRMTIYKMLKEGSIPASRIGHQWRFLRDDIDSWIRSRRIGQRPSVLIVDADPDVGRLLDAEMSSENISVVMAESGGDALDQASKRDFDFAFLQLKKSTVDVFKGLRDMNSALPVVVFVNGSESRLVDQAMEIGTFTLMRKPNSAEDVRNVLSTLPLKKGSEVSS